LNFKESSKKLGTKITHPPPNSSSIPSNYRLRTDVVVEKEKEKDAIELLELGVSYTEISNLLDIRLSELARIEEYNQKRREFLMTSDLDLPGQTAR
jgi:hypothetical protein